MNALSENKLSIDRTFLIGSIILKIWHILFQYRSTPVFEMFIIIDYDN